MGTKRSPDLSLCNAYRLGAGDLVLCASDRWISCDYAQPFGIQRFCVHPRSVDIASGTLRVQDPGGEERSD